VKQAATELGLDVLTPERAREVIEPVRASGAELGVVVAFGQLLPDALLDAVPHGFVNLHFSLLPRWRGAAPVERAILAGDRETGVCVMELESGLDTGPVYATERVRIGDDETAGELRARLIERGTALLVRTVPMVPEWTPAPQVGEPTYASKLTVEEFHLDPAQSAVELTRVVRAGNPRPGAWATVDGKRVKVLRARPVDGADLDEAPGVLTWPGATLATGTGHLVLEEVQVEGKRPMAADAWLAGFGRRHLSLPIA